MNWYTKEDLGFYFGGNQEIQKYNTNITKRRAEYPCETTNYLGVINQIEDNGYCIIPGVFSKEIVDNLKQEFDNNCLLGNIASDDEHYTMISDPLYYSKTSFNIATSDIIVDIASEYYKCTPYLCTQNFRLSKINNLPPKTTQLYHADQNSLKFIKFFIYLNDVDENGGPFAFVRGSNAKKFEYHLQKYRWEDKEIESYYGKENQLLLTAKAGDLIVAQTTGYHKGTKPINNERYMLTLNYLIHKENGMTRNFKVKKEWVDNLIDIKKRSMFDLMDLVE